MRFAFLWVSRGLSLVVQCQIYRRPSSNLPVSVLIRKSSSVRALPSPPLSYHDSALFLFSRRATGFAVTRCLLQLSPRAATARLRRRTRAGVSCSATRTAPPAARGNLNLPSGECRRGLLAPWPTRTHAQKCPLFISPRFILLYRYAGAVLYRLADWHAIR